MSSTFSADDEWADIARRIENVRRKVLINKAHLLENQIRLLILKLDNDELEKRVYNSPFSRQPKKEELDA
jgi:hypothetical protein